MVYFLYKSYVPDVASTNRALAYIRELDKKKIPITVVYFLPDQKRSKVSERFQYIKVMYYWEHLYIDHRKLKYASFYFYLKHFRHHLRKGDIVYVYAYNDICKAVLNKKDIKVFFEVTECPEVSLPSSPIFRPSLEQHYAMCKQVDSLFVISDNLKEYYISKGVEKNRIHVINMFVDPMRFDELERHPNVEQYIAYCGTATNNKDGVDNLIKAFALFSLKYPNVYLYIIGAAPYENDGGNNRVLVRQLGIEDKVVFTGKVSSEEIPQLLKNALILALNRPDNKQAKYGFPTKLGEYLATGNPVVITDVGNISLFLRDGESALIVPPNDNEAFANKLCWAFEHTEEARLIGERGHNVALRFFNSLCETQKLIDVIQNNK